MGPQFPICTVCTIILHFGGEELHIWHLILNINLGVARICYVLEHALASEKILTDFFFFQIWSIREVFLGGSIIKVAAHY